MSLLPVYVLAVLYLKKKQLLNAIQSLTVGIGS